MEEVPGREEERRRFQEPQGDERALVFKGTRVPVEILIQHLTAGDWLEDFLDGFPRVTREQAVAYLGPFRKLDLREHARTHRSQMAGPESEPESYGPRVSNPNPARSDGTTNSQCLSLSVQRTTPSERLWFVTEIKASSKAA
jgi:hypothetical protein